MKEVTAAGQIQNRESVCCSRALQHYRFLLLLKLEFISETVAAPETCFTVCCGAEGKRERVLLVENQSDPQGKRRQFQTEVNYASRVCLHQHEEEVTCL